MKNLFPLMIFCILLMVSVPLIAMGNDKELIIEETDKGHGYEEGKGNSANNQQPAAGQELIYKVLNHKTGEVMQLSPAEYIRGVVAAEMPIAFHTEALKAQAVAAHTYALRQIDSELKSPSPDMNGAYLTTDYTKNQAYASDEELRQRWGDSYSLNSQKLDAAVSSVINLAATYQNKPIVAAFHSISSGVTESASNVWGQEVSYLVPVESQGDQLSPGYENKTVLTAAEVEAAFKAEYPDIEFSEDLTTWFRVNKRSDSSTVTSVTVGSIECTGKQVRELLQLKSASFSVVNNGEDFEFTTNGYGHGVGMSQYGADYLARQGKTYDEILTHYYKGVKLEKITDVDYNL